MLPMFKTSDLKLPATLIILRFCTEFHQVKARAGFQYKKYKLMDLFPGLSVLHLRDKFKQTKSRGQRTAAELHFEFKISICGSGMEPTSFQVLFFELKTAGILLT